MNLRSGNRAEPEINLTSLIDVVLLLLVFFMITTSFVRESQLAIRLPEASTADPAEIDVEGLVISVTSAGRYLVNGRALVDSRPETLRAALQKLSPQTAKSSSIRISADANASHQAVVTAMDVAGKLGYSAITIATMTSTATGDPD